MTAKPVLKIGFAAPFESNGDRCDPQVSLGRVEQGQMRLLGLASDLIPKVEI